MPRSPGCVKAAKGQSSVPSGLWGLTVPGIQPAHPLGKFELDLSKPRQGLCASERHKEPTHRHLEGGQDKIETPRILAWLETDSQSTGSTLEHLARPFRRTMSNRGFTRKGL